jgi:hypothetical protein
MDAGAGSMHMGVVGGMHLGGGPHFGEGSRFGDRDFRARRSFGPGFAVGGFGVPYASMPYYGDDYDDYFHNECYVVRPAPTPFGWGLRRYWVC